MKKKNWSNIILIVVFFVGLSVLLYPTVSNYLYEKNSARVISSVQGNCHLFGRRGGDGHQ